MNSKVLLSSLIIGLFAATAAVAGEKPAPAPDDSVWTPPSTAPAYVYEPCFEAKPFKDNHWKPKSGERQPKPEVVEVNGKKYELKGLKLICREPAPAPTTPACVPTKFNNYCKEKS